MTTEFVWAQEALMAAEFIGAYEALMAAEFIGAQEALVTAGHLAWQSTPSGAEFIGADETAKPERWAHATSFDAGGAPLGFLRLRNRRLGLMLLIPVLRIGCRYRGQRYPHRQTNCNETSHVTLLL